MNPTIRLMLCGAIILASACYAVLVKTDPQVASAIASGYVAALVSVFVLLNVWKKQ